MAVAVKTSQGTTSAGPLASPAILSLVGVVYLLASLYIVFAVLPQRLWWPLMEAMGQTTPTVVSGSLLALIGMTVALGLLVLGVRLLGPTPPPGIRAGIFVGLIGIIVLVLLARWASLWFEHWVFIGSMTQPMGIGGTIAASLGFLLVGGWLFLLPGTQRRLVTLEQMGWFHATFYKSNQGQKVRRGTILGILLIVGSGIYTMISHKLLEGSPDWAVNVPFTGKVAITSYGDAQPFIAKLDNSTKSQVQINWGGSDKIYSAGQILDFQAYREAVLALLESDQELARFSPLLKNESEPSTFILTVNEQILGERMRKLLQTRFFAEGVEGRLRAKFNDTPWGNLGEAVVEFYNEAGARQKVKAMGAEFLIPTAVLLVDRAAFEQANKNADPAINVKVELKGDSDLQEGAIVPTAKFDEEYSRVEREIKERERDLALPTSIPLRQAAGTLHYDSITVLPSIKYTVPLLLLAASLWLAWRVVNMPAFADFLIATEAELNKVSWASQKKLVQDTIVVLVTVFLLSIFLFGVDQTWKVVLSWKPIGVLHIPPEDTQSNKPSELKRW